MGRKKSTGRFETREELEKYVLDEGQKGATLISIAENTGISQHAVRAIKEEQRVRKKTNDRKVRDPPRAGNLYMGPAQEYSTKHKTNR